MELTESLNIFNIVKLTPDLFKYSILHNCKKLIHNLETLGSSNRQQKSEKLINDFIRVIEIIDLFNPEQVASIAVGKKGEKSALSTQSKQLLQSCLKAIEKLTTQRHIKQDYFQNKIKPLLLDEDIKPEVIEEFLEQIYKIQHPKNYAKIIFKFFNDETICAEDLSAIFTLRIELTVNGITQSQLDSVIQSLCDATQESTIMNLLNFYRALADKNCYKQFSTLALTICKNILNQPEIQTNRLILMHKSIILITDKLCLFQLNSSEMDDYRSSIKRIHKSLTKILPYYESHKETSESEPKTDTDFTDYALHRAYFRLSEFHLEDRNIIQALNYHVKAIKSYPSEEVSYEHLFVSIHLLQLTSSLINVEEYIDEVLIKIADEDIKSDIKALIQFSLNKKSYCKDDDYDTNFENYQTYVLRLKEKYQDDKPLMKLIDNVFTHDKIWFYCLTEKYQELLEELANPNYQLDVREKIHIISITNNTQIKLLINEIDSIPPRLDTQYHVTKIYFDLFQTTNEARYLILAKNTLTQVNLLFQTISSPNLDLELLVCDINILMLLHHLDIRNGYEEYLDFLESFYAKKITKIAEPNEESNLSETFLFNSRIADYIDIAKRSIAIIQEVQSTEDLLKSLESAELLKLEKAHERSELEQKPAELTESTTTQDKTQEVAPEEEALRALAKDETPTQEVLLEAEAEEEAETKTYAQNIWHSIKQLKKYACKKLNADNKNNVIKEYGINDTSQNIQWSYENRTYESKEPSVVKLKDGLYAIIECLDQRHSIQIDNCQKTLFQKGIATHFYGADGVKSLSENHYEIKVSANGDLRLISTLILKNKEGKKLLIFNDFMNHSAVKKWNNKDNVKIIKTSATQDHLLDSESAPPHPTNSDREGIYKLESSLMEAPESQEDYELSGGNISYATL